MHLLRYSVLCVLCLFVWVCVGYVIYKLLHRIHATVGITSGMVSPVCVAKHAHNLMKFV